MSHLPDTLPSSVEQGAVRSLDYGTEIVTTDSGGEVRNNRWAAPLRTYEISFPTAKRSDAIYLAVVALYEKAQGALHSFNFRDWTEGGAIVAVRFATPLSITGVDRNLDQITSVTLKEVRL